MKGDLPFDIVELVACPAPPAVNLHELAFHKLAWLPDEDAIVRRLFAADVHLEAIAAVLPGRSYQAVRAHIGILGLRRNSKRSWSDLDLRYLSERYGRDPAAAIASTLGRSAITVMARANIEGLTEAGALDYTPWEDAQIIAGYAAGVPPSQIGVLIGRTLFAVMARAAFLGLRHPHYPADWTENERTRALDLASKGLVYPVIADQLRAEGYPARTKNALGQFLKKIGYARGWGRPWTEDEEELVRRAYAAGDSLTPLAERICRPRTSLRWKVKELGLQGTHPNHDGFRQGPVWTVEQDAFLTANYGRGKMKTPAIAAHLGRKHLAVCQRAAVLRLEHGYCRQWTESELRAVRIGFAVGLSLADLAEAVGRDVAGVYRKSKFLGLHFSQRPNKAPRTPRAKRVKLTLPVILAMQAGRSLHA